MKCPRCDNSNVENEGFNKTKFGWFTEYFCNECEQEFFHYRLGYRKAIKNEFGAEFDYESRT